MKRTDNSQKVNLPDLKFTPQLDMEMKPYYQKVKTKSLKPENFILSYNF